MSAAGPFVGRAVELDALDRAFGEARPLVTVTGMGGCGKTRLAHQVAERFEGPVWFVDLAMVGEVEPAATAVASAIGGGRLSSVDELPTALAQLGPGLMVLDAVEHLVSVSPQTVGAWCAAAPQLRFLATSRVPLGLADEQVVLLEPLPHGEAVELLAARARLANHRLDPDQEPELLGQIAARLEGIPLAIELAASRLQTLSVEQLRARLEQGLGVLRGGGRDRPARHMAMEAVLDASWALLSEREQAALAQCTVFRQPFTVDVAEAVLELPGEGPLVLDVLQSLHAHGLLRAVRGGREPRLALLDVVREYVAPRCGGLVADALEDRHTVTFLERVADLSSASGFLAHALDGTDRLDELEVDDLIAIVRRARATPRERVDAAVAVSAALFQRGPAQRLWQVLGEAMMVAGDDPLQSARLTLAANRGMQYFGLTASGFAPFDDAVQAALDASEWSLASQLLVYASAAAQFAGDIDEARQRCERGIQIAERADDLATRRLCAQAAVAFDLYASPMDECISRCRDMVEEAREQRLPYLQCRWLDNLGGVLFEAGFIDDAVAALHDASAIRTQLADPYTFGNVAGNQAECAAARGALDEARAYLDAASAAAITNPGYTVALGRVQVLLALAEGRIDDAQARVEDPSAWVGATQMVPFHGLVEYLRGLIWMEQEQFAAGLDCLEVAARQWGPHAPQMLLDYGVLRAFQAVAEIEVRRFERAELHLVEAREQAQRWRCARFSAVAHVLSPWVDAHVGRDPGWIRAEQVVREVEEGAEGLVPYLECRIAARMLARRLALREAGPILAVGPELSWVQVEQQQPISFRRGQLARRLIGVLVAAHEGEPGAPVPSQALLDAGWPGDRSKPEALDNRLWVALSRIRRMGLEGVLERVDGGYRLSPSVRVVHQAR